MKILVIRFSSIGDIVLTTPVLRCLRNQLPDAEIHFCTKKGFATLLEANPNIDKLHLLEDDLGALAAELKQEHFDAVIDLHRNLRTLRLQMLLRRPWYRFDKLNLIKWLYVKFRWNLMPEKHIVHRYMDAAKALGVNYDGGGLDHYFPEGQSALPEGFPLQPGTYDVYAIGGQHGTKKMPVHKMLELALKNERTLVLIGGKEDMEAGAQVATQAGQKVLNFCGRCGLHGSAAIIRDAVQVYSHDTGMMHIAAALKKPVISIWGNTVPEFGMYPFYPDHAVPAEARMLEVKGLACRPCSKLGFGQCPKGHFRCMEMQQF